MIRKHARSCIVAAALLAIPATAMAQTTPTTGRAETQAAPAKVIKTETASFQFWTLNCNQFDDANKTRNCVARLPVIRGDNQALIVVLSVTGPTQKDLTLTIDVPTSIQLKPGGSITFAGAGEPLAFAFDSCVPAGCTGTLKLDAKALQALVSAPSASVAWTSLNAGQVKFDFELKGAQAAITALLQR